MKPFLLILILGTFLGYPMAHTQDLIISDPWLLIDAGPNDPLYTTYTAAMERSRLYGDKGYKMNYWSTEKPLSYSSDKSGSMYCIWKCNEVVIDKIPEYHQAPVIVSSFSDMALSRYQPWPGLEVQECFMVYSSKIAMVDMQISNSSHEKIEIEIYPMIEFDRDSLCVESFNQDNDAIMATHYESPKRLISNLYAAGGYPKGLASTYSHAIRKYIHLGHTQAPQTAFMISLKPISMPTTGMTN